MLNSPQLQRNKEKQIKDYIIIMKYIYILRGIKIRDVDISFESQMQFYAFPFKPEKNVFEEMFSQKNK